MNLIRILPEFAVSAGSGNEAEGKLFLSVVEVIV
jgi:hypothetical protein